MMIIIYPKAIHAAACLPQDFAKSYSSDEEEMHRLDIWTANKKYVELHNANADMHGFTLGMNEYADLVSGCGHVLSDL